MMSLLLMLWNARERMKVSPVNYNNNHNINNNKQ